jgi:hypothetical protein
MLSLSEPKTVCARWWEVSAGMVGVVFRSIEGKLRMLV